MADHGEIFILDMGEPVKIDDMARQLIDLTGQKLYEELLIDESERRTAVDGITVAKGAGAQWPLVKTLVQDMLLACEAHDVRRLVQAIQNLVPEWEPSEAYREMVAKAGKSRTAGSESGRQPAMSR